MTERNTTTSSSCYAERGIATAKSFVRPSKIISRLVSLGASLSEDPNITDLFQGEHPEILTGIWEIS